MKSYIFILTFLIIFSCSTEPNLKHAWTLQREQQDEVTYFAIHFADENSGWIVGSSGTIKKTSDGGDSWQAQQSRVQSNLWEVCFINNLTGWICGADNTILKTTDGGETWQKIFLPGISEKIIIAIKFIDEKNGCISNNSGEILKSEDGGLSWQIIKQNNVGGARIAMFDENIIYFLSGKLFKTFDGGLTWDSVQVFTPENYMSFEMFFSDPENGYVTTINGTGGTLISKFPVMITNNGGDSWQSSEYIKPESYGFTSVYFTDKKNGWIAGNNIYKTTNGGESWRLEYSIKTGISGAKDLFFLNKNYGWFISWDGQIYKYENN